MKKIILFTITIFLIIFTIYFFNQKEVVEKKEIKIEEVVENKKTEIIKKEHTLEEAAWIPYWDYKNAMISLEKKPDKFSIISPVIYEIGTNGNIYRRIQIEIYEETLPTIANFDSKQMAEILNTEENIQNHINSIISTIQKNNYQGIDLDYESIKSEDKENYLEFLKKLSEELKKENKILSITILPQWENDNSENTLSETKKVQDLEIIGEYADQVKIMAYDYTPATNHTPGPIAPINWVEEILDYTTKKIEKEKIWLGIHLYSYEWEMPTENTNEIFVKTNSYTNDIIQEKIINDETIEKKYNEEFEEGYVNYPCSQQTHCIIYYQTKEGIEKRKQLAKKYQIKGVIYWRLGREGNLLN